jgi:ribosome assembly protein YihI (activator of Der GTPase)
VSRNYPEQLDNYIDRLDQKVLIDINERQNFWSKYSDNIFDKIQDYIYDLYLKSNNQEAGILTYNEVSIYIIEYYQRESLSIFSN